MKPLITFFSSKSYDIKFFSESPLAHNFRFQFISSRLDSMSAAGVEKGSAICAFANDELNEKTLLQLKKRDVEFILLRSAGFNHVDIKVANSLGLKVARVPAYSPHSVAEHTVALMLGLNRKIHRAYNRVREGNFALEGLMGFDFYGKTLAIIGTGKIGECLARIALGLGMKVLAYDPKPNKELLSLGVQFEELESLWKQADVISLHCPLTQSTRHLINQDSLSKIKHGVMLINTGRGALVDTSAAIVALKEGKLGSLGLDVYEEEENLFFTDHSGDIIQDDVFSRLMTFPNVLMTGHQAFFTKEAMTNIVQTTLENATNLFSNNECSNLVVV
jgi:D-lactate dehydrogenase